MCFASLRESKDYAEQQINRNLSDDEVKQAVEYSILKSRNKGADYTKLVLPDVIIQLEVEEAINSISRAFKEVMQHDMENEQHSRICH